MIKRLPLLIAVLALAVWAGNFIIKNFLAVSLIAYGQPGESSDAAVGYAPDNAEVLASRARYLLYRADPPRTEQAIADLRKAVGASPHDYRYRLELGKAYNSDGQWQQAEVFLQQAVELAPRYFEPRWVLANLRLRTGKTDQALNDFREAVALSGAIYGSAQPNANRPDHDVTLNALNAVAGAMGMNLDALRRITPPGSVAQAYLAEFFATHDAMDQALEIWRGQPSDDQNSYRSLVVALMRELQNRNRFSDARDVWQKFSSSEGVPAGDPNNLVANPGFELTPLREKYAAVIDLSDGMDWVIRRHTEVRAVRDNEAAHSGANALHLVFVASMASEFNQASQVIAVEPKRQYRLTYFAKTKNISSLQSEAPFIEVTDAANPALFMLRSAVPSGTVGWSEQSLVFTTPDNTQGLRLTVRAPQLKIVDRTRTPELWLDDFNLTRLQ